MKQKGTMKLLIRSLVVFSRITSMLKISPFEFPWQGKEPLGYMGKLENSDVTILFFQNFRALLVTL